MLTLLPTLKLRLAIDADPQYDDLLTNAIRAVSARFDKETHRTLARTVDFQQEFDTDSTEILANCYPVETVTKFECPVGARRPDEKRQRTTRTLQDLRPHTALAFWRACSSRRLGFRSLTGSFVCLRCGLDIGLGLRKPYDRQPG